ncbi:MAG: AI-2E family transporter [Deltaproteobacteria bacterium]|nr:AI-2E family transporter [Deltaproteobacteria bacterium]
MRAAAIQARGILAVAALVVVISGLKAAASWVLPSLLGLLAAIFSLPVLRWLQERRLPRVLAVVATAVFNLGWVFVLLGVVGSSIAKFVAEAPKYQARFQALTSGLIATLNAKGIDVDKSLVTAVQPRSLVSFLESLIADVGSLLSQGAVIFLVMFFFLLEADLTESKAAYLASRGDPNRMDGMRKVFDRLQSYLGFKTAMGLIDGILTAAFTAVMGVEFAPLWGLLTFVFYFVPNVGSLLSTIPPVLVALLQVGPGRALGLLVGYVILHTVLNTFIEPRVVGKSFGVSPLATFLAVPFFGWMWGPVGMLLAVPLLMVIQIVCDTIPAERWVAVLLSSEPPEATTEKLRRPTKPRGPTAPSGPPPMPVHH